MSMLARLSPEGATELAHIALALIFLPLVAFLTLCSVELSYVFSRDRALFAELPASTFLAFLPSGVTAAALMAVHEGRIAGALYYGGVLAAIAALTVIVGA